MKPHQAFSITAKKQVGISKRKWRRERWKIKKIRGAVYSMWYMIEENIKESWESQLIWGSSIEPIVWKPSNET